MRRRRGRDILARGALWSALLGGAPAALAQELPISVAPSPTDPGRSVVVSTTLGGGASAEIERRNLAASIAWRTYHKMGWEALRAGKNDLALSLFRAEVKEAERLGASDPRLATSYNDLGWTFFQMGRAEEAEPLARWALDTRVAQLGAIHPEVGDSLILIAKIATARKQFDEAEQAARGATTIYFHSSSGYTDRHPPLAIDVLGEVHEARGELDQAQALFQRAFDLRQNALGIERDDRHISARDLAVSLRRLAGVLRKKGDAELADEFDQRAADYDRQAEAEDDMAALGPEPAAGAVGVPGGANAVGAGEGEFGPP